MEPTRTEQGARETGPFCPELLDQQSQASGCWAVENWTQFWVGGLQVTLQRACLGGGLSGAIQGAHILPFLSSFKSWILGLHLPWILTPGTKDLHFQQTPELSLI